MVEMNLTPFMTNQKMQPLGSKKVGRYQAMFSIFLHDECSEIKVPIREDLFINITDSFVSASCVC